VPRSCKVRSAIVLQKQKTKKRKENLYFIQMVLYKPFSTSGYVTAHGDALMDAIELCSKSTSFLVLGNV
jgi:hypothetical protein